MSCYRRKPMEKIVVIGDVHGLRTWEQVVEKDRKSVV